MVEYAPIGDLVLVRSIPDAAWDALAEIQKKRPGMMLGELLAVGDRKRAAAAEPKQREPRSLATHPSNPARAPKAG
jgi:hypothetical protein